MTYYNSGLNASVDGIANAGMWIAFHTADPAGVPGANEVGGRSATVWSAPSGGTRSGSQVNPSIPSGNTLSHWSVNASQSGTNAGQMLGSWALDVPQVFSQAGTMPFVPVIAASN